MKLGNEIRTELEDIAPLLARMERRNPYTVPVGYFEAFSEQVLQAVKAAESVDTEITLDFLLQAKQASASPAVPEGYFASFAENMLQKIRMNEAKEELRAVAPQLAALPKTNFYSVPTGYFEQLPSVVMQLVGQPRQKQLNWWLHFNEAFDALLSTAFKPQYTFAYASCITAVMVGLMFFFKPQQTPVCDQLACLTTAEIEAYINSNIDEFEVDAQVADNAGTQAFFAESTGLNADEVEQFLMDEGDESDLENAFENS